MLIGLTGYARTGKDSFANGLAEQHGFVKVAFAGALKELVQKMNPILGVWPEEQVRLAQVLIPGEEDVVKSEYPEYRRLLKALGNGVRDIDPDFWIRAAMKQYALERDLDRDVVITDCRFLNEAAAIRDAGGYMVRIVREGYGPESDFEKEVDQIKVDAVVGAPDVSGLHALVDPTLGVLAKAWPSSVGRIYGTVSQ